MCAPRGHSHQDDPSNNRACCFDITWEGSFRQELHLHVPAYKAGASSVRPRKRGKLVAEAGLPTARRNALRAIVEFATSEHRVRTGDTRRMRPLPYHLATPRLGKCMARRPGAAPEMRGFGDLAARWHTSCCYESIKTNTTASPVVWTRTRWRISRRIFRCFRHTSRGGIL
jgi:hypothetical protein